MNGYRERPWLGLYQPGKPADIKPEYGDALAMWRGGAGSGAAANQPFLYYFDTAVTGDPPRPAQDPRRQAASTRTARARWDGGTLVPGAGAGGTVE